MIRIFLILMLVCSQAYASVNFDGVDDYITCPVVDTSTSNFSMSIWVKPLASGGVRSGVFYNGTGANGWGLMLGSQDGGNQSIIFILRGGLAWMNSGILVTANSWQHFAVVNNGGSWTLYINGVATSMGSGAINTPTTQTLIGGTDGGAGTINHISSECTYWNTALSANEILSLYRSRLKRLSLQIKSSNVKAYWPLDDFQDRAILSGSGTIKDRGVFGNNGTQSGSPMSLAEQILSYP